MAGRKQSERDEGGPGWIATVLGMAVLLVAGFVVGVVVGVIAEEPELMLRHWAGQDEELAWSPDADAVFTGPGASDPELVGRTPESETGAQPPDSEPGPAWEETGRQLPPVSTDVASRPPSAGAGFAVQVGAFSESSAAEKMSRRLDAKGYSVYVIPSQGAGDGRWRVRVGPVASRSEAQELARRLKVEQRLPTWVVTEGGD